MDMPRSPTISAAFPAAFRSRRLYRWNLENSSALTRVQSNIASSRTTRSLGGTRTVSTLYSRTALKSLRNDPKSPIVQASGSVWDRSVRIVSPVLMGEACVRCHNTHPESPKKDWKVGDVRGIQEISVSQPLGANLFA